MFSSTVTVKLPSNHLSALETPGKPSHAAETNLLEKKRFEWMPLCTYTLSAFFCKQNSLVVEPTCLKNMLVKLDHFPRDRDEHKKYLKPSPRKGVLVADIQDIQQKNQISCRAPHCPEVQPTEA